MTGKTTHPLKHIFKYQFAQLITLALLVVGVWLFYPVTGFSEGSLWGIPTIGWLCISLAIPAIHQFYVALYWRLELHFQWPSAYLGKASQPVFAILFLLLFCARLWSLICLAIANAFTFMLPLTFYILSIVVVTCLVAYAVYSALKYLGFKRISGGDHFDRSIKSFPSTRYGLYHYTDNALYKFAALIFFLPGLCAYSTTALISGLFSYCFIWAHFYCTEKPDMNIIYGQLDNA
ncbi:hypothetical protein [Poriferisphaera sp. WC338]|uniref:hypothetical protein n=1 Tax=Poriferisphaera sp. WC338 TaxID=3425129 RepID=UPI003D817D76